MTEHFFVVRTVNNTASTIMPIVSRSELVEFMAHMWDEREGCEVTDFSFHKLPKDAGESGDET